MKRHYFTSTKKKMDIYLQYFIAFSYFRAPHSVKDGVRSYNGNKSCQANYGQGLSSRSRRAQHE